MQSTGCTVHAQTTYLHLALLRFYRVMDAVCTQFFDDFRLFALAKIVLWEVTLVDVVHAYVEWEIERRRGQDAKLDVRREGGRERRMETRLRIFTGFHGNLNALGASIEGRCGRSILDVDR